MKHIIKFFTTFFNLKLFADKRQFVFKFKIHDAPIDDATHEIVKIYIGSGLWRRLKIAFGKRGDFISIELRKPKYNKETPFGIYIRVEYGIFSIIDYIATVKVGQQVILTLTLKDVIHIMLNNRIKTIDVDMMRMRDRGYTIVSSNPEHSWIVKFDN